MTSLIEPTQLKNSLGDDGILFVRNDSIFDTMVKIPLLVASMIIVAALLPVQSSFSSPRDLDLIIYPDGTTHVTSEIDIDPFLTDYELNLFGKIIDNLVVIGDDEFLLDADIIDDSALDVKFDNMVVAIITPDKDIIPDAENLNPAYIVFENYEIILKWNRSLRFSLAVCTLKDKFINEL